jgi:hypothetical protein
MTEFGMIAALRIRLCFLRLLPSTKNEEEFKIQDWDSITAQKV